MIMVGLLGCGTVGSGVVKLLEKNQEIIAKRSGDSISIKRIMEMDLSKCLELGLDEEMISQDFEEIVQDDGGDEERQACGYCQQGSDSRKRTGTA